MFACRILISHKSFYHMDSYANLHYHKIAGEGKYKIREVDIS